jgi:P pilus assembly chaperone PapD
MKWNSKNWQGKREDQVESSYASGYVVVMILTVLAILLLFSSCSTSKGCYIQRSSVAITDEKENVVYIKNTEVGQMIYNYWTTGTYGNEYKPVLVTDSTFVILSRKIN